MFNRIKAMLKAELKLIKESIARDLERNRGNGVFLIVAAPW